jgi:enoyl-CoA hydratase
VSEQAGPIGGDVNGCDVLFKKEGALALITIDRQAALNALNESILKTLDAMFRDVEGDEEVRVVIMTGAGEKAFVAGADLKEIKEAGRERTAFISEGQRILSSIRTCKKVVIAAVNGYALGGGCELALACDIRIASKNARFGLPEASLGLIAGYGGTQLLSRLVGPGMAKYMIFSGAMLSAEDALRVGLVERICERAELLDVTTALALKVARCGPIALSGSKRAIDEGLEMPLADALRFELELYDEVSGSEDAEEGISAFLEKRKPVFRGK